MNNCVAIFTINTYLNYSNFICLASRKSHRKRQVVNYTALHEGDTINAIKVTCPECRMSPEEDDNILNVIWYGCDFCLRWWYRHCLDGNAQTLADLSTFDSTTKFRCPACPEQPVCGVCLQNLSNLTEAQCYICLS